MPRKVDGVLHQHRNGHWPDSARHGSDGRRNFLARFKVAISNHAIAAFLCFVFLIVDTDVYYHSRTADIPAHLANADIVVAAIGKAEFVKG